MQVEIREIRVETRDGVSLGATLFTSRAAHTGRFALVAGGVGVMQERFADYASFMTGQGWSVVTFDYRGVGRSISENAPVERLSMQAWGDHDLAALIDWITGPLGAQRLVAIVHSIGGQVLPFAGNHGKVDAVLAVGAQRGAWRHWDGAARRLLNRSFFGLYIPWAVRLSGRLPLGFVNLPPLPRCAALDWARWGLNDEYLTEDGTSLRPCFAAFRAPILALSIADDHLYAPQRAVDDLFDRYYINAPVLRCHVLPERQGMTECGHFGFFNRSASTEMWWRETSTWLSTVPRNVAPEAVAASFGSGSSLLDASVVRLSGAAIRKARPAPILSRVSHAGSFGDSGDRPGREAYGDSATNA